VRCWYMYVRYHALIHTRRAHVSWRACTYQTWPLSTDDEGAHLHSSCWEMGWPKGRDVCLLQGGAGWCSVLQCITVTHSHAKSCWRRRSLSIVLIEPLLLTDLVLREATNTATHCNTLQDNAPHYNTL